MSNTPWGKPKQVNIDSVNKGGGRKDPLTKAFTLEILEQMERLTPLRAIGFPFDDAKQAKRYRNRAMGEFRSLLGPGAARSAIEETSGGGGVVYFFRGKDYATYRSRIDLLLGNTNGKK